MAKAISTQIRRNNSNNITYVLKKFADNTFEFSTYQLNVGRGCYYLVGRKRGVC